MAPRNDRAGGEFYWGAARMVTMDWTNVAVASITVVGTLGGGIVTQAFAIRSKRIDAKVQRDNRAEELRELTRKEATDEKRTVYAGLNTTAHSCRAAIRHYLDEKCGGRTPDHAKFEAAREALRDTYSRAQMVLSDRALDFASEVNRCLDVGHRASLELDENDAVAVAALYRFVDDSLGFGVRLLRRAIREDLGIEAGVDADLDGHLVTLRSRRHEFVRRDTSDVTAQQLDLLG
ncbi:hypothetical protein AB0J48_08515 [Nocardia salmonicida]|uniref:hypothetical protein n=1 Tax=Nocardia salmonicida TaxID=53431 RepID=UPI003449BF0E